MLLFYTLAADGTVLGRTFTRHLLEVPEDVARVILADPHWREATDAEAAPPEPAPPRASRKKAR